MKMMNTDIGHVGYLLFFDRINRIYRIEEEREERLAGTVRPTSAGECSVSGRDERPRSSADAIELLVGYGNRGWLKPSTPEKSF